MTIVEKIQQSITAATGLRCYYQSAEQLNTIADNINYPCAYFFLLQQQQLNVTSARPRERVQIAVFFVNMTEFDFNSIENERIIDGCKERALQWVRGLSRDKYLRLISNNGTQRVYDEFDVILTGFAVNVTVEELVGADICDEPLAVGTADDTELLTIGNEMVIVERV